MQHCMGINLLETLQVYVLHFILNLNTDPDLHTILSNRYNYKFHFIALEYHDVNIYRYIDRYAYTLEYRLLYLDFS